MSCFKISGSTDVSKTQTKDEFLESLTKKIENKEKHYSECSECGIPIAKGDYMCSDCYWRLREGI